MNYIRQVLYPDEEWRLGRWVAVHEGYARHEGWISAFGEPNGAGFQTLTLSLDLSHPLTGDTGRIYLVEDPVAQTTLKLADWELIRPFQNPATNRWLTLMPWVGLKVAADPQPVPMTRPHFDLLTTLHAKQVA